MKIQIIVGSTRQGRQTDRLAKWVLNQAETVEGVSVELLDLRDFELPFFNEPISPRYNPERKPEPAVDTWLKKIAEADGYIIVTPEYDHSIPGVLKNALDFIAFETVKKPMAIVSHGTVGGARAAEHLKGIISEIQAVPVPVNVAFAHRIGETVSEEGVLEESLVKAPYGPHTALQHMLSDLVWYTKALTDARAKS